MLQESVVELVSATWAGSAPTSSASRARACARRSRARSKYAAPLRPRSPSATSSACMASSVGADSGPNVPAFR